MAEKAAAIENVAGHGGVWALRSRPVVTPSGVIDGAVLISGEKIWGVVAPARYRHRTGLRMSETGLCCRDWWTHTCTSNERGRTEWEGFETATRAAAAGGITTLFDMPLNSSPVTTTCEDACPQARREPGKLWVDCGFYGGIVPGVHGQAGPMSRAGVAGFKAFLCHSGINDFPNASPADLKAAMSELASLGLPLLVHAELVPAATAAAPTASAEARSYRRFLASRPRRVGARGDSPGHRAVPPDRLPGHIVHLASADACR